MHDWTSILEGAFGASRVGREAGILTEEDFKVVDDELTEVLRQSLTAMRAFQPVVDTRISGAGITEIETYSKSDRAAAVISMSGEPQPADARTLSKEKILAPVIHADSKIPWRIGEAGMAPGAKVSLLEDLAGDNGAVIAQKMDDFVYSGDSLLGVDGFLSVTGRTTAAGNSWSASADNVETDVLNMLNDMDDNDISPENNNPVLFVHTDEAVALRKRFGSGSDTRVGQSLIDDTELAAIVTTKRQTSGTVSLLGVARQNMRLHILEDVTSEQFRTSQSRRASTILGTWAIPALKVRHAEAFIERTAVS